MSIAKNQLSVRLLLEDFQGQKAPKVSFVVPFFPYIYSLLS